MFIWFSSVLNTEPTNEAIQLEESVTMGLDDLVNQLSNVTNPATWNDSNFSFMNISLRPIGMRIDAAMVIYHHVQKLLPVTHDYN